MTTGMSSAILTVVGLVAGLVLGLVALLWLVLTVTILRARLKYKHLPSPRGVNFYMGHLKTIWRATGSKKILFGDLMVQWAKELGPVYVLYFFHKATMVVCSAEGVKELLITAKHPKDRQTYENVARIFGERFMGNGMVTQRDHSIWAIKRSIVDPAFHRKYLKQSMVQFNRCAELMAERLRRKADGASQVIMQDELNKVTLDVIAKVSFSRELDIMSDGMSPFTNAVRIAMAALGDSSKDIYLKYSPLGAHREYRRRAYESCRLLRRFGEECVRERLVAIGEGQEVPADTLTFILNATDQLTHPHYGIDDMVDDFVTMFVAGQETTANLLASCLNELLSKQPEVVYRMRNEMESVLGDKTTVSFEDLPKLEYTNAVLKESLRLFPPAGGTVRETVEETYINGQRIPINTSCIVSFYAIARNESYFKNASVFDPDHFMRNEEHVLFSFLPFSLGPRICLGKNFAMIEAKVLLCKLLMTFDMSMVPGQSLDLMVSGTIRPKDGCKVTLKERSV